MENCIKVSLTGFLHQSVKRDRISGSHVSEDGKARRPIWAGLHGGEHERLAPAEIASSEIGFEEIKKAMLLIIYSFYIQLSYKFIFEIK